MVMTYVGGQQYDRHYYSHPSHNAPAACYARSPYAHPPSSGHSGYDTRHSYHDHYSYHEADHASYHAVIGDPEPQEQTEQQPRRRIAVACQRCRRRKIKCSGEPADGSGCVACKTSGGDVQRECTFNRVNSEELAWQSGVGDLPSTSTIGQPMMPSHYASNVPSASRYQGQLSQRVSLPTLETRSAVPSEAGSFQASPVDAYEYVNSALPRQQSFSSYAGLENFRCLTTTSTPMPMSATTAGYDPYHDATFGAMPGPFMPQPQHVPSRLPSVTGDSYSSLNMGHLNASLPNHVAYERRLPIPPPPQEQQQAPISGHAVPQIRPLALRANDRPYPYSLVGRPISSWAYDTASASSASTAMPCYASLPTNHSSSTLPEPVYQFALPTSSTPEVSSTSGPADSETYSNIPGSSRYSVPATSTYFPTSTTYDYSAITTDDRTTVGRSDSTTYSFSSQSDESDNSEPYENGGNISAGSETPRAGYIPSQPSSSRQGSGSSHCQTKSNSQDKGKSVWHSSAAMHHPRPQQHSSRLPEAYGRSNGQDDHDVRREGRERSRQASAARPHTSSSSEYNGSR